MFQAATGRGILVYVEPGTNEKIPLEKKYQNTKAEVDAMVLDFIDEVIRKHLQMDLVPSSAASKILMKARSVFDGCYLQLAQLMMKSPEESTQHLKLCEVPSCGRLFWAPDLHTKYCKEHPKATVWAQKKRAELKASAARRQKKT